MSSDASPIAKADLIRWFRQLFKESPTSKAELRSLEDQCTEIILRIENSPELGQMPHELWHYLFDADIRFKDSEYSEAQTLNVANIVDEWESEASVN